MLEISVIVPTYNRKQLVCRALESIKRQTLQPSEVIIVDDGSTDGTFEMLQYEYPEFNNIRQAHSGVSKARNSGLAFCENNRWVAFLDSDDEWKPGKLEKQAVWITRNPDYSICHCDEIWIRKGTRVNPMKKHKKLGGWIYPHCLPLCVVSPSTVLIHSSVFEQVGKFDESLPVCEDYDLWLRISNQYRFGYMEEKLVVKHGGHDDQLSRAYPAMDQYRIFALDKILRHGNLDREARNLTLGVIVEKLNIYINGARKRNRDDVLANYQPMLEQYSTELGSY